jgi:hypothetical protein
VRSHAAPPAKRAQSNTGKVSIDLRVIRSAVNDQAFHYERSGGHILRWTGNASRPSRLDVLTAGGWRACGLLLSWRFWRKRRGAALTADEVERSRKQACCPVAAKADRRGRGFLLVSRSWLRWVVSPPLGWGAPRWLNRDNDVVKTCQEGVDSFDLGPHVDDTLVTDSTAGWEGARTRLTGIETRAATFVQAAALTSTLVLANQGLIAGDHPVRHAPAKWIFLAAILTASTALIISGIYGLYATMRTFDRIAPNNLTRILARSKISGAAAKNAHVAANLMAQRRTSLISDWKLARLKRATVFFGIAVAGIAVASGTFVIDATTHHAADKTKPSKKTTAGSPRRPTFPNLASATIELGDDASYLYTIPAFSESVSGVVHFVTRDALAVPGAPEPQHLALSTKPVEARKGHKARVRLMLSRRARQALADRRTIRVGVRLEMRGDGGASNYDPTSCVTLGARPSLTHTGC